MTLFNAAERFASMDRSTVTLDTVRCLHSQDRYSECDECFHICPVQAIRNKKPPVLDTAICQNCLACLTVCPVGAYHADDAVAPLLNSVTHLEGKRLELLCSQNKQAQNGAINSTGILLRGCLAGLGTGAYLALSAFGLERIAIRLEACSTCEWAVLRSEVEWQILTARHMLTAWEMEDTLTCVSTLDDVVERPLWNADNPPLSRRDLFRMVSRQGQLSIARAMENEQGYIGRRPGRNRQRILNAITHLSAPTRTENLKLSELKFANLSVSEACTACGACARGCPTDALQFTKNDDERSFQLSFLARNCIDCGLCTHVCLPAAIAMKHDVTFQQISDTETVVVQEGPLVKCARCGTLTAKRSGTTLCSLCEFRRTHPFGSMLPPGLHPTLGKDSSV